MTWGAVAAGCVLLAACTPASTPTGTPTPSVATASSGASPSASPTESDIERQMRLDYEAAEKAYRANIAEQDRQGQAGTADLTPVLKNTGTGAYLRFSLDALRELKRSGQTIKGTLVVVGVTHNGWKRTELELTACEDGSDVRLFNKKGKDITPKGANRYVQALTVTKSADVWRVADESSTPVKDFEGQPCAA